ncbi:MAG: hypothetical protein QW369_00035 [Desulfurococcaceae archaeon]
MDLQLKLSSIKRGSAIHSGKIYSQLELKALLKKLAYITMLLSIGALVSNYLHYGALRWVH